MSPIFRTGGGKQKPPTFFFTTGFPTLYTSGLAAPRGPAPRAPRTFDLHLANSHAGILRFTVVLEQRQYGRPPAELPESPSRRPRVLATPQKCRGTKSEV